MEDSKIRVLIVDDHPLFRRGLATLMAREPDLEPSAEAGNQYEAQVAVSHLAFDVALVDVRIPPSGGAVIVEELRALAPSCRVLGLSVVDEPCIIADMLRAGAAGYALKTQAPSELMDAVRAVASGAQYLPSGVARDAIEGELAGAPQPPDACLTRREHEVFDLLIQGYSNSEIATKLYVARRTVETHRYRITRKLHAHSVLDLQRVATRTRG
jgi:DNA-binding NarL/FixJ family response regulator